MPSTKKRPQPNHPETPSSEVMTLAEAAAFLKVTDEDILQAVRDQGMPGRQVGSQWRFCRRAIQRWLRRAESATQKRKEAQLALIGKYREDPDLLKICEDAYQQRKQMTEKK